MTTAERSFRVVVLSGPSGVGKTTIVNRLVAESPIRLVKAISATTRPPRNGEQHGEAYYFLSPGEFAERKSRGEFLETAEVYGVGYWYGTLASEVDRARLMNGWSFLEIDVQGALRILEMYPDAVTIFLKTPSEEVFEKRLRSRGTESEDTIRRRLQRATDELKLAHHYKHHVINDDLNQAVRDIIAILEGEAGSCSKN